MTIFYFAYFLIKKFYDMIKIGSKDMEDTVQEQELCQKQSILGDMLRNNPFVMEMQW